MSELSDVELKDVGFLSLKKLISLKKIKWSFLILELHSSFCP